MYNTSTPPPPTTSYPTTRPRVSNDLSLISLGRNHQDQEVRSSSTLQLGLSSNNNDNNNNSNVPSSFHASTSDRNDSSINDDNGGDVDAIIDADSVWAASIEPYQYSKVAGGGSVGDGGGNHIEDIEQPTSSSPPTQTTITPKSTSTNIQRRRRPNRNRLGCCCCSSSSPSPSSSSSSNYCFPIVMNILREKIFERYKELVLIIFAIIFARIFPTLGSDYTIPSITCEWVAIVLHFALIGVTMNTNEFVECFIQQWKVTTFIQCFNFGIVSFIMYLVSGALMSNNIGIITSPYVTIGMIISSCFPVGIISVMKLTKETTKNTYGYENNRSGGGSSDEDTTDTMIVARFQTNFGTILSIVLSPILIYLYLSSISNGMLFDVMEICMKLILRVILPFIIGQTLRWIVKYPTKVLQIFQNCQLYTIIFMIYTIACVSFDDNTTSDDDEQQTINGTVGTEGRGSSEIMIDIFVMAGIQLASFVIISAIAWLLLGFLSRILFPININSSIVTVTSLFGCCHKSLTVGIPLLVVMFGLNTPHLGLYMSPLLVWYTIQLLVGYFFVSPLKKFVNRSYQQEHGIVIKGGGTPVNNESESTFEDEEVGVTAAAPAPPAAHQEQDMSPPTVQGQDDQERIPYIDDQAEEEDDDVDDDDNSLMFNYIHQRHSNDERGGDVDGGHDDGVHEFVDDEINSWLSEMAYSDIVFDETSDVRNNTAAVSIGSDDSTYFDDDEEEEETEEGELFHDESMDGERQLPSQLQQHTIVRAPDHCISQDHRATDRRQTRPTYGPRPDLSEEWKPTLAEI